MRSFSLKSSWRPHLTIFKLLWDLSWNYNACDAFVRIFHSYLDGRTDNVACRGRFETKKKPKITILPGFSVLEEVRRASQEAEQASHGHGSGDQGGYNPAGGGSGHGYEHADPKISVNEDDLQTEIPGKDISR